MYPFPNSATPAIRSHLDAQASFFNEIFKSLSRSFQSVFELNIQLGQTLLEESNLAGHQLLTTENPTEVLSIAASCAQPASEKLRAYQQHIAQIMADAQVELARVTEKHGQETSRTARELAEQVGRAASEEAEKSIRIQQETMKAFSAPFQQKSTGGNGSMHAPSNMQSDARGASSNEGDGAEGVYTPLKGNVQGTQPAAKGGAKAS